MIAAMLLALAAPGDALPIPPLTGQVEDMRCGTAELRIASRTLADRAAPLAPVDQTLTRRAGGRQVPVALERSRIIAIGGFRVRDRYVASWACLTGHRKARYFLVGYACAADIGSADDCGGRKEWFRLLDSRGRFADVGLSGDGRTRDRLYARIGIDTAMAAGVAMTPVIR